MLLKYQKKLVDLCREDKVINNINLLSKEEVDELYKQKLLLSLIENNVHNLNNIIYRQLIYKKSRLFKFFKYFCNIINNFGIDYVILKGFAYDILIYNNIYTRTFSDIDILINSDDFSYFINKIANTNIEILSLSKKHDYYLHEVKLYLLYENERFLVEVKTRHRDLPYEKTQFLLNEKLVISYNDLKIFTFNYELTLISMIIYIYNYFERIASILYLSKVRLCYFYDLNNFIKKYNSKINIGKLIDYALELGVQNKIILVLQYLLEIFFTMEVKIIIDKIVNNMNDVGIYYNSPARIVWNFGILDRIFCEATIKEIIKNYYEEQFYIGDYTSQGNIINYNEDYICFKKYNVNYKIKRITNGIMFELNNLEQIPFKNYIIYFVFFYKDRYGGFTHPFNVISIRKENNDIYVFNNKTVEKNDFTYHPENETNLYSKYESTNRKFKLIIDFDEMNIRNLGEDKLAFYFELMIREKNHIYIIDRNVDDDTYPKSILLQGGTDEKEI